MKKLISSILICAMGFGMVSCVESVESPSIETIRNSKVEQLKALANLYNAEAQAELIWAKAEADLLAADAAYAQAEAELEGLELQKAKDAYAAQLEALLASYKNDLTSNKALIAEYEATLRANLDALEDAVNARISALYTEYETALTRLNIMNTYVLDEKVYLAQIEAEVIDVQTAAEKDIAKSMQTIAEQEEIIADAEAQLAILTDNAYTAMNKDSLNLEYLKALVAYKDAKLSYEQNEAKAVSEAEQAAAGAFADMYYKFYNYETNEGLTYVVVSQSYKAPDEYWPFMSASGTMGIRKAPLTYYVSESGLERQKRLTFATDYEKEVEDAEAALEAAKAAEAGFKGFEQAFEDAEAAKQAIEDYNDLKGLYYYGEDLNTSIVDNTVEYWESNLVTVKADTLAGTANGVVEPINRLKAAKADLDVLTNEKNEGYKTNTYVKALADAKAALKTVKENEDATEAEIAAAEAAVTAAQKALDKAIYDATVALKEAEANMKKYEDMVAEAEAKIADAKEMEKELLAANGKAIEAVETLNKLFGAEGEFIAFWNKEVEDENGNKTYPNRIRVQNYKDITPLRLLADKDVNGEYDKNMDSNGNVIDGTYIEEIVRYAYCYFDYNYDYHDALAIYTSNVASKTDELTTANNNLANMGEWQKNWDAKEAELREFVAGLNEQLKEVQALVDAYNEATEAAQEVSDAVTELKNASEALGDLVLVTAGDTDLNDKIDEITKDEAGGVLYDAKAAIAEAEEAIAAAEKILEGYVDKNGGTSSSSSALVWLETKIEKCKNRIKIYESRAEYCQIMVERTKTALDAAISAASAE